MSTATRAAEAVPPASKVLPEVSGALVPETFHNGLQSLRADGRPLFPRCPLFSSISKDRTSGSIAPDVYGYCAAASDLYDILVRRVRLTWPSARVITDRNALKKIQAGNILPSFASHDCTRTRANKQAVVELHLPAQFAHAMTREITITTIEDLKDSAQGRVPEGCLWSKASKVEDVSSFKHCELLIHRSKEAESYEMHLHVLRLQLFPVQVAEVL